MSPISQQLSQQLGQLGQFGQLWRTATFRLALIYLALFGISVVALVAFLYVSSVRVIERQTDETIEAEITGLSEQYRGDGLLGLRAAIAERSRGQRHSLYLLVAPGQRVIAGNLDAWPRVATGPKGWLNFSFGQPVGRDFETREARARHILLDNGFQLLVGRDIQQRLEIDALIRESLVWAVALLLVFGLAGGVFMSRRLLSRIQAINLTSQEIVAGDLSRRIPVSGSNDEIDRLAINLNHMLDQIEQLMEEMRQVTDNIAHDLRDPLNRLRTRIDVTLMATPSAAEYREVLEGMVGDTEQLLATFNALLKIAQVESGVRNAFEDVDLTAVVRDLGELYAGVAEEQDLEFSQAVGDHLIVHGDRELLAQALANLLDNAIKYTPGGGKIYLTAERASGRVTVAVADSGPGIVAAERERVLNRFVRLETSRNSQGSGLGLSLVRAVAGLHGAVLALDDADPGLLVTLVFAAPAQAASNLANL